nr:MAG TPA: hypothetical protein [Caudoviricetes sp.]
MNRSNDNGLSRAEFKYLYDTDNENRKRIKARNTRPWSG